MTTVKIVNVVNVEFSFLSDYACHSALRELHNSSKLDKSSCMSSNTFSTSLNYNNKFSSLITDPDTILENILFIGFNLFFKVYMSLLIYISSLISFLFTLASFSKIISRINSILYLYISFIGNN